MLNATNTSPGVQPLAGTLPPQCGRDVDTLRRFVHALVSQQSPADPVSPPDFREVLLTGATGFIGRFFLCDLLQQDTRFVVHCVVRADGAEHGRSASATPCSRPKSGMNPSNRASRSWSATSASLNSALPSSNS
ncbi:MAG: hypothetical protein F4186_13055, partial [Boseongicola sp. SB0676_bin_33]|nr:hypothetical protein [Boseongicola sp. SB0676_bin_33]